MTRQKKNSEKRCHTDRCAQVYACMVLDVPVAVCIAVRADTLGLCVGVAANTPAVKVSPEPSQQAPP